MFGGRRRPIGGRFGGRFGGWSAVGSAVYPAVGSAVSQRLVGGRRTVGGRQTVGGQRKVGDKGEGLSIKVEVLGAGGTLSMSNMRGWAGRAWLMEVMGMGAQPLADTAHRGQRSARTVVSQQAAGGKCVVSGQRAAAVSWWAAVKRMNPLLNMARHASGV